MIIAPAQITLTSYDSCRFRLLNEAGEEVPARWEIRPGDIGTISAEEGAYTAPRWIWFARSVVVCASATGADGEPRQVYAEVKLSNLRALTWSLFLFLAVVATLLVAFVIDVAPHESRGARFELAPRQVVLSPGTEQQFVADGDVKWSTNAPRGLFAVPAKSQGSAAGGVSAGGAAGAAAIQGGVGGGAGTGGNAATGGSGQNPGGTATSAGAGGAAGSAGGEKAKNGNDGDQPTTEVDVYATSKTDADWVDSARVKLDPEYYLRIEPARPVVERGKKLKLEPDTNLKGKRVSFEASEDGLCDAQGVCQAKNETWMDRVVLVTAKALDGRLKAQVSVRFVGTRSDMLSPILLGLLFGALGGLLHAINSLIGYVGNDKFLARWSHYYLARPFIGAVVGLIVVLVFKGNLAAGSDIKGDGFYTLAAIAALAGMFSDPATHKLKEIFDVVLGPKRDDRTNTMDGAAPRPPAPPTLTITRVTPPALVVGTVAKLVVSGSGFTAQSRAQIDAKDRETKFETTTQLSVQLKAEDVASARQLSLVVVDGAAQSPAQLIEVKPGAAPPPPLNS